MQNMLPDTAINDSDFSSLDADVFIPIDPNWRKEYYKKVFRRRVAAFFLDYFTTYIMATFLAVIVGSGKNEYTLLLLQLIFFIVICAIMESSRWQGTFGKRIMKIQITDDYGNSISFFRSLARNLLRIVIGYSYCLILPLIFQFFRFRKTKKLFHDELSHTIIGERLKS